MSTPDEKWWIRARRARELLEAQLLSNADVRLITIGLDPERLSSDPVLIVQVRQGGAELPPIPSDIDGIAVRVTHGDYDLQKGTS